MRLLQPYKEYKISNGCFVNSDARNDFVRDIFSFCSKRNVEMTVHTMAFVSKVIVKFLPNEIEDTYYYSKMGGKKRGGKIYNKQRYFSRNCKKIKLGTPMDSEISLIDRTYSEVI